MLAREKEAAALLTDFRGDLDWIHEKEGHRGHPYWPGGQSGVTLDPGVDLGHVDFSRVVELYRNLLSPAELDLLEPAAGLRKEEARDFLSAHPAVRAIAVNEAAAMRVMPVAAKDYWRRIADRFSPLRAPATPASVQTVLLSLAYNRGSGNDALEVLAAPLASASWGEVARKVAAMQQNHELEGIRVRRRHEAELVRAELELYAGGA